MPYSKPFFDLQIAFARRLAALAGLPLERALLDYTNLYVRFGLGRDFDAQHPVWLDYLAGAAGAVDLEDWTWRFFLARPESGPPGVAASFGCFSYAWLAHEGAERVHLHFADRAGPGSPLDAGEAGARRAELAALVAHLRRTRPEIQRLAGLSWLYNLSAYRRLFPPAYLASARPAPPRFRNMPLWGQFLDRHGSLRPGPVALFRGRLAELTALDDAARCFPLQPLTLEAPVADFP